MLGDLADDLADGAGGAADEDGLALLGLADLVQRRPARQAGHAELADEQARLEVVGVLDLGDPGDGLGGDVGVLGDGDHGDGEVALLELGRGGPDDLDDAAVGDGGAEGDAGRVRLDGDVAHAAAQVRVEGGDEDLDDEAALGHGVQVDGAVLDDDVLPGHGLALGQLLQDEGLVGSSRHLDVVFGW